VGLAASDHDVIARVEVVVTSVAAPRVSGDLGRVIVL
jgi:hypothetical protein